MADQERESFRKKAGAILAELHKRGGAQTHELYWGKMWALMREARAAGFTRFQSDTPWHFIEGGVGTTVIRRRIAAGDFSLLVPVPTQLQLGTDLPGFLNWAGVPEPRPHLTEQELTKWINDELALETACRGMEFNGTFNKHQIQSIEECNWSPGIHKDASDWVALCRQRLNKALAHAQTQFNLK
jgi:hypothetical protein